MKDIVANIFAVILAVLFMFFVPLSIILLSTDKISQRYVDNAMEKFKNTCLTSGEITEESYQRLVSDLGSSGYSFHIELEHQGVVNYLDENNKASTRYMGHGNDEIVETISSHITNDGTILYGIPYKMQQGDYLKINIVSTDSTYGSKIANTLTFGAIKQKYLYGMDSGMVRTDG